MRSRGNQSARPASACRAIETRRPVAPAPPGLAIAGPLLVLLVLGLLTCRAASAQTPSSAAADSAGVCNVVDDSMLATVPVSDPGADASDLPAPGDDLAPPGVFVGPPLPPLDFEPFPRPSVMPPMTFSKALGIPKTPFGKQIYKVALRHALNPQLVAAVIQMESAFNPRARSSKGAFGLMQLLPSTARRFGVKRREILNPLKNLEAGTRYLKWLAERFEGDTLLVLAAYNAGEGSVERFGGVPPFRETREYVQRIFARLGIDLLGTPPPGSAESTRAAK